MSSSHQVSLCFEGCKKLHLFFCLMFLVIFEDNFKKQSMNQEEILWQLEKDIYQFNLENNENK